MKKTALICTASLSLLAQVAFSQPRSSGSFTVGAVGTGRSTWLLNKNISETDEQTQAYEPSFGIGYGISLGSYFSDNFGVELDVLMSGHQQKYKGGTNYFTQYHSRTNMRQIDLPLTVLIKANSGSYFEIGAMYTLINKATYSKTLDSLDVTASKDVSTLYQKNSFAGLIGFGMEANLSDQVLLQIGFRVAYGLTDLKGVDGQNAYSFDNALIYSDPYQTHQVSGGIHFGIKYMLEY
ncbi:MAG: outer membrane beta-barrel protein [Flavobacteriales bacterium]|nr:outer membrane beta-barrel protein [Flavobacteriales bacterium]MCB9447935.1 outer membrane beta-barrel protein [Flavobacteriales bacterium]